MSSPASGRASASASLGPILSRIACALLGGYAFTWGFAALLTTAPMALWGVAYDEAQTLAFLLAFLVFLVAFLWAFGARSVTRVWAVLLGGGAAMTAAAWALQRSLLS